eukprot:s2531_g15.t1
MALIGKTAVDAVEAVPDDVETISTCSGGTSASADAEDPQEWPNTDDECCYPKSHYRPPRRCWQTDLLAKFVTTVTDTPEKRAEDDTNSSLEPGKAPKITSEKSAAMLLQLNEANKFGIWLLERVRNRKSPKPKEKKPRTARPARPARPMLRELPDEVAKMPIRPTNERKQ